MGVRRRPETAATGNRIGRSRIASAALKVVARMALSLIIDARGADTRVNRAAREQLTTTAVGGLIEDYHHTAAAVLDRHVDAGGCCAACDARWPCRPACAAAFALEL